MAAGDAFLCVTGAAKIKVYDRDGKERGESVLGDPYIRDTKNTKGHQSPCTSGHWHPTDRRALPAWLLRARAITASLPVTAGVPAWCACMQRFLRRSGACAVLRNTDRSVHAFCSRHKIVSRSDQVTQKMIK